MLWSLPSDEARDRVGDNGDLGEPGGFDVGKNSVFIAGAERVWESKVRYSDELARDSRSISRLAFLSRSMPSSSSSLPIILPESTREGGLGDLDGGESPRRNRFIRDPFDMYFLVAECGCREEPIEEALLCAESFDLSLPRKKEAE